MSNSLRFVRYIPDVIWGYIPVTELENAIIESDYFSRLREVKQMGVASTSFPGALHNRFQHSIGVMHTADKMLTMVRLVEDDHTTDRFRLRKGDLLIDYVESVQRNCGLRLREIIRITALLHDLGHPPLSHLVEELFRKHPDLTEPDDGLNDEYRFFLNAIRDQRKKYSHESATKYLLQNNPELHGHLVGLLQRGPSTLPQETDAGIKQIAQLTEGNAEQVSYRSGDRDTIVDYKLFNPIIVGDLDADKMDYILRDSYFCGTEIKFSIEDFYNKLYLHKTTGKFYIDSEAITAATAFLYGRYRTISDVQHHPASRIATQYLIERIGLTLRQLNPVARGEEITNMHVEAWYVDSELDSLLSKVNQNSAQKHNGVTSIRTRNLKHKIQLDASHFELHPISRGFLHNIVSYPRAIAKLQELLRKFNKGEMSIQELESEDIDRLECYENDEMILDIRDTKPPDFQIDVYDDRRGFPPVYNWSETARGILNDSIKDLTLYLYAPDDYEIALGINDIANAIRKVGLWASECSLKEYPPIPISTDLILLIMHAVFQDVDNYGMLEEIAERAKNLTNVSLEDFPPSLWIHGQSWFQKCVHRVTEKIALYVPSIDYRSINPLSAPFFRDLEVLRLAGLITVRQEVVDVPEKEGENNRLYTYRYDYKLTAYGNVFCEKLCESSILSSLSHEIYGVVSGWQSEMRETLIGFAVSEAEKRPLRPDPLPVTDSVPQDREFARSIMRERGYRGCFVVL